jgi:hypothetical protein
MCKTTFAFFQEQPYGSAISTLAGVVGALIIAAIALRLTSAPPSERLVRETKRSDIRAVLNDLSRPLLAMPTALVAALLASYSYGVIAGTSNQCLAAELTLFAGAQLAIAAVLTLFAITWLLRDYEAHQIAVLNARLLTVGVAAIASFFLKTAIGDEVSVGMQDLTLTQWLTAAAAPLVVGLVAAFVHFGHGQPRSLASAVTSTVHATQVVTMVAILTSALSAVLIAAVDSGFAGFVGSWLQTAFIALVWFALSIVLMCLPKHDQLVESVAK